MWLRVTTVIHHKTRDSKCISQCHTSLAEETSELGGKFDSIMLKLDKLNVFDELVVQVRNLTKSLEFCHESIAELKLDNTELRTQVTELGRHNSEKQGTANVDHDALVDLTWRSMRDNLLFHSILEAANDEDCEATVQTFFKNELGITEDIRLERVHRMGRRVDGKCRPIVTKFSSYKKREVVRLAGPKLAGKLFGISEQIPKEWHDRHKAILPAYKDTKRQGQGQLNVAQCVLLDVMKGTCSLRNQSSLLGISRLTMKEHDVRWTLVKKLRKAEASATSQLGKMATSLPNKKLVSKKTWKGASVLQQSLREMHREFFCSATNISFLCK